MDTKNHKVAPCGEFIVATFNIAEQRSPEQQELSRLAIETVTDVLRRSSAIQSASHHTLARGHGRTGLRILRSHNRIRVELLISTETTSEKASDRANPGSQPTAVGQISTEATREDLAGGDQEITPTDTVSIQYKNLNYSLSDQRQTAVERVVPRGYAIASVLADERVSHEPR